MSIELDFDNISQTTKFEYKTLNRNRSLEDYEEQITRAEFCIGLLHSHSLLSDSTYFDLDQIFGMDSFLVYIDDETYQIDPYVFTLNEFLIIIFEVIDFSKRMPLNIHDIHGKKNYNLLEIDGFSNFDGQIIQTTKTTIPALIYSRINAFVSDIAGRDYRKDDFTYVHDTLIIADKIDDLEDFVCKLIGIKTLSNPLLNISTTDNYEYYLQDGVSILTNFVEENRSVATYNAIILESMKLYIYLYQIISTHKELNSIRVLNDALYLDSLFFAPKVPIETYNFLNCLYETESFKHRKTVGKLQLSFLTSQNEIKKNKNATLLNILLYFVSLFGAISALETIERNFYIPFRLSFFIVTTVFVVLGIAWTVIDLQRNKK